MAQSTESQIQALVARFTADLLKVVQEAALASFASAFDFKGQLNGAGPRPARGRRAATKGGSKRTVGGRRDPKALDALTKRVGAHIAAHAGQGVEEIGAALHARTAQLALPIKKLLADKTIKKRGNRRSTRYFPA
jgi:hypothetical protein